MKIKTKKVLAECNHRNIVRYYHAWREYPPSGWQENQDATQLAKCASSSNVADDSFSDITGGSTGLMTAKESNKKSPAPSFASIFGEFKPPSQSCSFQFDLTTPNNTLLFGRKFDQYLYIQMELCRKESLARWLDTRQPAQDVYQIYQEILQAVAHLHYKVATFQIKNDSHLMTVFIDCFSRV